MLSGQQITHDYRILILMIFLKINYDLVKKKPKSLKFS